MSSLSANAVIADKRKERRAQRFPGAAATAPTEITYTVRIEADNRHIALPPAIAARIFKARMHWQREAFYRELRDFRDRYVVSGCHIESFKLLRAVAIRVQHRGDHIGNMNIGFTLSSVAKNRQAGRIGSQATNEVEAYAMRLARPYNVTEAKRATAKVEHKAIGTDERLTRELARSISRDRQQRSVILLHLQRAQVAVNSAA